MKKPATLLEPRRSQGSVDRAQHLVTHGHEGRLRGRSRLCSLTLDHDDKFGVSRYASTEVRPSRIAHPFSGCPAIGDRAPLSQPPAPEDLHARGDSSSRLPSLSRSMRCARSVAGGGNCFSSGHQAQRIRWPGSSIASRSPSRRGRASGLPIQLCPLGSRISRRVKTGATRVARRILQSHVTNAIRLRVESLAGDSSNQESERRADGFRFVPSLHLNSSIN